MTDNEVDHDKVPKAPDSPPWGFPSGMPPLPPTPSVRAWAIADYQVAAPCHAVFPLDTSLFTALEADDKEHAPFDNAFHRHSTGDYNQRRSNQQGDARVVASVESGAVEWVSALHDWDGVEDGDLDLRRGDIIEVGFCYLLSSVTSSLHTNTACCIDSRVRRHVFVGCTAQAGMRALEPFAHGLVRTE